MGKPTEPENNVPPAADKTTNTDKTAIEEMIPVESIKTLFTCI